MLYGDPTFEFAPAAPELLARPARPAPTPVTWPQVTRGEEQPALTAPQQKRSQYVYPAVGMLLLAVAYFGYQFFSPKAEPRAKNCRRASASAGTESSGCGKSRDESSTGSDPSSTSSAVIAKPKEPMPIAKNREIVTPPAAAAPLTKPQEVASSPVVKGEIAVAKENLPRRLSRHRLLSR